MNSQAIISLDRNGRGLVTIDGTPSRLNGPDLPTSRDHAKNVVVGHARAIGQPVALTVSEPDGARHLVVSPDGGISEVPAESAPAPVHPAPGQPEPAQQDPFRPAPAQQDPFRPAPVQQDPFRAAPVQPPPVGPAPVQSAGVVGGFAPRAQAAPAPVENAWQRSDTSWQQSDNDWQQPEEQPYSAPSAPSADPELTGLEKKPAAEGLRGAVNRLGLTLAPGPQELESRRKEFQQRRATERELQQQASRTAQRRRLTEEATRDERATIQTNFRGTRTILVANPKGGARKTTSTYCLAATMGTIRGGAVVAWDANETMGTLGDRSLEDRHNHTVVDLLEQAAPEFESVKGSRLGLLDSYVRPQGDSHFDVLASDEDPTRQDIVGEAGFATIHEILSRFYRLILVDTGNNIRAAHFQAALEATDQLVIPIAASRDSARVARMMMRAFTTSGHGQLVEKAVVLLHDLEPAEAASSEYLEVASDIAAEFEPLVAAVVGVPFDSALKDGDRIEFGVLSADARTAYRQAAAAIARSLTRDDL